MTEEGFQLKRGTAEDNRWTKWVQENMLKDYNVNVKYVIIPRWESIQKYNLLFAADEAPDLVMEFDTTFRNQLFVNKQIIPLDDLIEKHSTEYKGLIAKYPAIKKIAVKEDGKMYDFVRALGATPNHMMLIRNDWLKNLNLPVPQTVDDLYKVAKAFAEQDPDGNGKKDTLAMSYSFVTGYIVNKMFQDEGLILKDDKIFYGWDQMKAGLEFQKKLYDEGLVDKDYATDKNGAKSKQDFLNSKLGIYGQSGGAFSLLESLRKNDPKAEIITMALPKSQFGQFGPVINVPLQPYGAVNSSCKNPDAAIKYIDFMTKESTFTTLRYGFEGVQAKLNEQGAWTPIDSEKSKTEVGYNQDLYMACSPATYKYYDTKYSLDLSDPLRKEYLDKIWQPALDIYLDSKKSPMGAFTDGAFLPAFPQDLVPVNKTLMDGSTGKLSEIRTKAIVSGASYSVDAAMKDAQDAWAKGGGDKLVQFMNDWYQKNKDTAVFAKDIFEAIEAMKLK